MSETYTDNLKLDDLSHDELALIFDFRMLDKAQQEEIIKQFEALANENEEK
jgi:hypothetical protein